MAEKRVQVQFTDPLCHGVSVRENGRRTPYKRPDGRPVVEMPQSHAETLLKANTPGVERHRGRCYAINAPWLPSTRLRLWSDTEHDNQTPTEGGTD